MRYDLDSYKHGRADADVSNVAQTAKCGYSLSLATLGSSLWEGAFDAIPSKSLPLRAMLST